ncbi:MAG: choice-of-anchor tandem repeat GloVer-containing protein [Candidatus Korobacteraceae bacterium]|jgi:uncharacterized repeat protein (TIGR03803 family)
MAIQSFCKTHCPGVGSVIMLAIVFSLTAVAGQGQTFAVLHNFTGGQDGANPLAGVSMDRVGNLYGTASLGALGYGTVYKLALHGTGWVLTPLYQFRGGSDGFYPEARVIVGPDGRLYGTTFYGGNSQPACLQGDVQTCGTVFQLRPQPTACTTALCPWTEAQIYLGNTFPNFFFFGLGDLVFDPAGNLYGTALQGGNAGGAGGVFELTPSGGGWTETNILDLGNQGTGGAEPFAGVIRDSAGNLYGTTGGTVGVGNYPYGSVYELSPSGSGWTTSVLHQFQDGSDGSFPKADLILDAVGNLYGTTPDGGSGNSGTVFELAHSEGGWVFSVLYSFTGPISRGPWGPVLMDAGGNLYGTTLAGGAFQQGSVFKLTHSNGSWTYTSLHDFTGDSDGRSPYGHLIFDANGNLYGTAGWGGANGDGVVWEVTP